jgi:hypothetical protein
VTVPLAIEGYPPRARKIMEGAFRALRDEWTHDVSEKIREGMETRLAEEIARAFKEGHRSTADIIAHLTEDK